MRGLRVKCEVGEKPHPSVQPRGGAASLYSSPARAQLMLTSEPTRGTVQRGCPQYCRPIAHRKTRTEGAILSTAAVDSNRQRQDQTLQRALLRRFSCGRFRAQTAAMKQFIATDATQAHLACPAGLTRGWPAVALVCAAGPLSRRACYGPPARRRSLHEASLRASRPRKKADESGPGPTPDEPPERVANGAVEPRTAVCRAGANTTRKPETDRAPAAAAGALRF
jgi:hypothetical protein